MKRGNSREQTVQGHIISHLAVISSAKLCIGGRKISFPKTLPERTKKGGGGGSPFQPAKARNIMGRLPRRNRQKKGGGERERTSSLVHTTAAAAAAAQTVFFLSLPIRSGGGSLFSSPFLPFFFPFPIVKLALSPPSPLRPRKGGRGGCRELEKTTG